MTVSTTSSRVSYNGDGVMLSPFAAPFYFLQSSDLAVYVGGVKLTLTTDYSVTGAGNSAGGFVSFIVAPPVGVGNIVIIRDPDQLQSTKYPANDPFPSKSHETALDKLTMLVQRTRDLINRAFVLPDSDTSGASLTVPTPIGGGFLGWNALGTALVNYVALGTGLVTLPLSTLNGGLGAAYASFAAACSAISTQLGLRSGATTTVGSAATQNVGIAAGNVVQLDGSAKLPGVDGSQLLNLPATFTPSVRQSVLSGSVDASGYANWLSVGAGLTVNLSATAIAVRLAFATGQLTDALTDLVLDANNQFGAIPANNTAYLYADRASGSTITGGNTLIQPQYDYVFDKTRMSLMRFQGTNGQTTTTDDFGTAWTLTGATISTGNFKFGASSLATSGGVQFAQTTAITNLGNASSNGNGNWEFEVWFYATASSVAHSIVSPQNASVAGAQLLLNHNGGARKLQANFSSDGSTNNIGTTLGTTTVPLNQWHRARVVRNKAAATYTIFLSVNGAAETQEIQYTATTVDICPITMINLGYSSGYAGLAGNIGPFVLRNFITSNSPVTPPVVMPSITDQKVCWFDIPNMMMREATAPSAVSGANPTFTARTRVFVGEADAGGASISAVRSYAYSRKYRGVGGAMTVGVPQNFNHNIGLPDIQEYIDYECIAPDANYVPGDRLGKRTENYSSDIGFSSKKARTVYSFMPASGSIGGVWNGSADVLLTAAKWRPVVVLNGLL